MSTPRRRREVVLPATQVTRAYSFGYDPCCIHVFRAVRGGDPVPVAYFSDLGSALRYVLGRSTLERSARSARTIQGVLDALEAAKADLKAWTSVRVGDLEKFLDDRGKAR